MYTTSRHVVIEIYLLDSLSISTSIPLNINFQKTCRSAYCLPGSIERLAQENHCHETPPFFEDLFSVRVAEASDVPEILGFADWVLKEQMGGTPKIGKHPKMDGL